MSEENLRVALKYHRLFENEARSTIIQLVNILKVSKSEKSQECLQVIARFLDNREKLEKEYKEKGATI